MRGDVNDSDSFGATVVFKFPLQKSRQIPQSQNLSGVQNEAPSDC